MPSRLTNEMAEVWDTLGKLERRLDAIEKALSYLPCLCEFDWTDGGAYCQQCGRKRRTLDGA